VEPERWLQVEDLFNRALELEEGRRAEFLKRACAGDDLLRREVESLLAHEKKSEHFIESSAVEVMGKIVAREASVTGRAPKRIGTQVSHYRILAQLGSGGMGVVYEAEDTHLHRKVALKFLSDLQAKDPQALARFQKEAQAASALNHPNICTIHDITEQDGETFIAMEFLDGATLAEMLRRGPLELTQLLGIAEQVLDGLEAAHNEGIIHRDIKLSNIFLTKSGRVKILDFGLAKRSVSKPAAVDIPTLEGRLTHEEDLSSGSVMLGTAAYMSPEQALGKPLDVRTDIFSFGIVLYEMATGCAPFQGESTGMLLLSIVKEAPEPLREIKPDLPEALQQIVDKCLQKDRNERYQSPSEIRNDLRQLQRSITSEKIAHTEVQEQIPEASSVARAEPGPVSKDSSASVDAIDTDSARKPAGRMWKIRIAVATLAIGLVLFAGLYAHFHETYSLKSQDTLVLAEFTNTTGNPVFDGALREALTLDLSQSPFLNVLSQQRVTTTLKQMEKPADERLTVRIAREICLRTNSKALIAGSIALVGERYTFNLRVLDCQNEEILTSVVSEAENRNLVLPALHRADEQLRRNLGESLGSIKAFNVPLAEATTSSLEALQLYSQGQAERQVKGSLAGIPYLKRAIEIDPNFGQAYASLGSMYLNTSQWALAKSSYRSAYALGNRVSERERFYIEFYYFQYITDESDTSIRVCNEWIRSYPNDSIPHSRLGAVFLALGRFEKATQEYREALRLGTDTPYSGAMLAYLRLGRLDEAKAMFDAARSHNLDSDFLRQYRVTLAFLEGDDLTIRQQLDWAKGKPGYEETLLNAQSEIEAYHGHVVKARDLEQRAKSATAAASDRERAAEFDADSAWREAEIGNSILSRKYAMQALAVSDSPAVYARVAMASARAGDNSTSEMIAARLNADYPHSVMVQNYVLPTIRALIAINNKRPGQAIAVLQPALPFEQGELGFGNLQPAYVRGLAYLQLKKGQEAAIEFQKLVAHPGVVGLSVTGALAKLQLARAEEMSANRDMARKHYQDFFATWKDADIDIPVLMQAKDEYAKLGYRRENVRPLIGLFGPSVLAPDIG